MKLATAGLCVSAVVLAGTMMFADDERGREGVPRLDHVFVIMMENHSYSQILDNPNAPFANAFARARCAAAS